MNIIRNTSPIAIADAIEQNHHRKNTVRAYERDRRQFYAYSKGNDNEEVKRLWLVKLAFEGKKYSTIKRKAVAIGANTPKLKRTLKGLKNSLFDADSTRVIPVQAEPILKPKLSKVARRLHKLNDLKSLRDHLIITIGWIACLRVSELAAIKKEHLVKTDIGYRLQLPESKNMERGSVTEKLLPYSSQPELNTPILLDRYLDLIETEYLFTRADLAADTPLSHFAIQKIIKRLFDPKYSFHSLRSGFISQALIEGCTFSEIMNQSKHKSISTLMIYDRTGYRNNASLRIV